MWQQYNVDKHFVNIGIRRFSASNEPARSRHIVVECRVTRASTLRLDVHAATTDMSIPLEARVTASRNDPDNPTTGKNLCRQCSEMAEDKISICDFGEQCIADMSLRQGHWSR
jgi:hypothetical protein